MPDPQSWLLLAHAGHWILWVLYALPLIAVVAAIWISSRRSPEGNEDDGGEEA
jgi:hypothetical protein